MSVHNQHVQDTNKAPATHTRRVDFASRTYYTCSPVFKLQSSLSCLLCHTCSSFEEQAQLDPEKKPDNNPDDTQQHRIQYRVQPQSYNQLSTSSATRFKFLNNARGTTLETMFNCVNHMSHTQPSYWKQSPFFPIFTKCLASLRHC